MFEARRQEYVGIEIEPTQTIDRKIPKEVVALNPHGEGVEHGPVLGKLGVNEFFDLAVIEE